MRGTTRWGRSLVDVRVRRERAVRGRLDLVWLEDDPLGAPVAPLDADAVVRLREVLPHGLDLAGREHDPRVFAHIVCWRQFGNMRGTSRAAPVMRPLIDKTPRIGAYCLLSDV